MRIAAALFLFLCIHAGARADGSVFLEELAWTDVRDATQAGRTTIIIPVGGTEQNGAHMALGKHNVRVRVLSGRIASALGNALVAPVIAYAPQGPVSPPTGHMRFPGTITVPDDVFEKTLESAARGFRLHGFKDIVFVGDHGGYQKILRRAADTLNRDWAKTSVRAHAILEYYDAFESYAQSLKEKGFKPEEIGTHAGLADTAVALAVDPALVRSDRLQRSAKTDGVSGDPRRATADLGKAGADLIVERTVDAIRRATQRK
jgi:creatinine amidohydrolase